MDTLTQKFRVRLGLFIAVGGVLFFIAIFIIGKQRNLFNPVFKLTSTFYNVSGLQVGNNIRFSGINVGTVDYINIINDSTVKVEMSIKKDVNQFIKSDCKVAIGSEGLIGDKLLIISQGSSDAPLAKNGQQLISKEPVETDAVIASLHVITTNVETLSKQFSDLMSKLNSGRGTLGRLIQDSTIVQNIDQTMLNLKNTSRVLNENINSATKNIFGSLEVTALNSELVSNQFAEIMLKLNSKNSSLGRLIQDSLLIQNLDKTMENLKNSSRGLDENIVAAKSSFLLRGYFKKKENDAAKAKEDSLKIAGEQKTKGKKDY
jgi:phospholipid/cholesterol/gamma-HCH transport system substrate-binding protein